MSYVTIVDLAEMIKLGIQSFFIWGHLVSHLSKFDQVKFSQMKKQHIGRLQKFQAFSPGPGQEPGLKGGRNCPPKNTFSPGW